MAACQITISGASGQVEIRYTIGLETNTIIADIGDPIYIDDSATDVTAITLSGDATAASGCVTISAFTATCYEFTWETTNFECDRGDIFEGMVLDEVGYDLQSTAVSSSYQDVATAIDEGDFWDITPMSGKYVPTSTGTVYNHLIVQIFSSNDSIPYLKIFNGISTFHSYLKGVPVVDCFPVGYTPTDSCYVPLP